jgi:N-acetylmuramoyl-L-alanine amidase
MHWNKGWLACGAVLTFCLLAALPLSPAAAQENADSDSASAQASPTPAARPSPAATTKEAGKTEAFVVIDPSHGGDDRGAVLTPRLVEKDVTLAFARELRKEFEERGIPVRMVRDSDVSIGLDRRAEAANQPHATLYIALHAGTSGRGIRVYFPMLFEPEEAPKKDSFLPWQTAQSASLKRSRTLAQEVSSELEKKKFQALALASPLRPLNNVVAPAIAVELAPEGGNPSSLAAQKLQNNVSSAIAAAIAQTRAEWSGTRE